MQLREGRFQVNLGLANSDAFRFHHDNPYSGMRSFPQFRQESIFLHYEDLVQLRQIPLRSGIVEMHSRGPSSDAQIVCYEDEGTCSSSFTPRFPNLWNLASPLKFKVRSLKLRKGSYRVADCAGTSASFRWMHGPVVLIVPYLKTRETALSSQSYPSPAAALLQAP
jgi:hypothetical protein